MTESEWIAELIKDGYSNLLFCDAIAHEHDDEHAHDRDHKMIIFSGDVEITIGYQTVHLGIHDYFEIPRGTEHFVVVGAEGCRYLIAERL
jgi:mannose-6-phosphate isomerase-like protein (cupin superfamily)